MPRRRKGRDVDGIVLLDKPVGLSSNAALQRVRRLFDARKAGHTGSLDPLASGLLPVCLGEATKISGYLLDASKKYRVTAIYGRATTTGDGEGETTEQSDAAMPNDAILDATLADFLGAGSQIPPMYSALKHNGRPLYELAREGHSIAREPRSIHVRSLRRIDTSRTTFTLEADVSSGTYIRTLVEDIAAALGGVAHVGRLRRTGVGPWAGDRQPMHTIDALIDACEAGRLDTKRLPVSLALADWPRVVVDDRRAWAVANGQTVELAGSANCSPRVRVHDERGALHALAAVDADRRLSPFRVFARAQR